MICKSCNQEMVDELRINVPGTLVDVRLVKEEETDDVLKKSIDLNKDDIWLSCCEVK